MVDGAESELGGEPDTRPGTQLVGVQPPLEPGRAASSMAPVTSST